MDKQEKNLREQKAPVKNSDHAFVQVGQDGGPVMPKEEEKEKKKPEEAKAHKHWPSSQP